jgi:GGDEF domain-containing protein
VQAVDTVSSPIQIEKLNVNIRATIGVALRAVDGTTSEVLLRHADAAMYRPRGSVPGPVRRICYQLKDSSTRSKVLGLHSIIGTRVMGENATFGPRYRELI